MIIRYGQSRAHLTNEIYDGKGIRQTFRGESNFLNHVSIEFGTYCRKNSGTMYVEVVEPIHNKVVGEAHEDLGKLEDNSYHLFHINAEIVQGNVYELRLRTKNCRNGASVTAKYGRQHRDTHFFVGPRLVNGELSCNFDWGGDAPEIEEEKLRVSPLRKIPDGELPGMISVVIPHYNCSDLLSWCLSSILKQTYNCIEVIVVDDGSEKKEIAKAFMVIETYKGLMDGIQLVKLDENMGAPYARNRGAELASGEFIMFVDSDCYFYHKSFEFLLSCLNKNKKATYAYGGFKWGDDIIQPREFDLESLHVRNFISTMSMVRRGEFVGFDESLKRHQDWDLWLSMAEKGRMGICAGGVLFETPMRDGISNNENISIPDSMDIVKRKHGLK